MPFTKGDLAYADNNRQYLHLGMQAYETIKNDMFTFHEEKQASFINRVFNQYYPMAEASISRMLNQKEGELARLLDHTVENEKTKDRILQVLLQQEEKRLKGKAMCYESDVKIRFWLNKENIIYLTEVESECNEEKYYDRRGEYIIKCIGRICAPALRAAGTDIFFPLHKKSRACHSGREPTPGRDRKQYGI